MNEQARSWTRTKVFDAVKTLMEKQDLYISGVAQQNETGASGNLEEVIISQYRDYVYVKTMGIHGDIEIVIYHIAYVHKDMSLVDVILRPAILFADADCPVYNSNYKKMDKVVQLKQADLFDK
jgi:hypothetical protein